MLENMKVYVVLFENLKEDLFDNISKRFKHFQKYRKVYVKIINIEKTPSG